MAAKSTEPASGEKWVPTNLKPLDDEPLPSGKRVGTVILEVSSTSKPKHQYRVIEGSLDKGKGVAWGFYNDVTNDIGWSVLQIDTSKNYLDEEQMYAAGLLEGFLTATRIRQLFINDKALRDQQQLQSLYSYFEVQDDFIRRKYREAMKTSPTTEEEHDTHAYWRQVGLELAQLDGLLDGYNNGVSAEHKLRLGDVWLLNMDGDVIDLERAFSTGQLSVDQVSNEAETKQSNFGGLGDLTGQMRFKEIVSIILKRRGHSRVGTDRNVEGAKDNVPKGRSRDSKSANSKHLPQVVPGPKAMKYKGGKKSERYSEKKWDVLQRHSRCSALIKVLPDFSDVYVGHTTWADYSELLRIWKTYNFQLKDPAVLAKKISFSSYAGMISSTDDWYITDTGLLILETTTNVEDENALSQINPKGSVVSWIRTMVANRLANNGRDWAEIYAQQNSGTYNCEWMVLDYKKFRAGEQPQDGFFTMIEQVPGKVHKEDMTKTLLNRGDKKCLDNGDTELLKKCKSKHMYWPSINRPYWKDIRDAAGYPLDAASTPQNEFFSFEDNPRGRILQRDQKFVGSVEDMMALMQYNDPSDPMQGKAGHAIAARFDVPDAEPGQQRKPTGGIESKVTNAKMVKELASIAVLGPAHSSTLPKWRDQSQKKASPMKAFRWDDDDSFMKVPHYGIPMELGFPWQMMGPAYRDSFPQSKDVVHNEIDKHETDLNPSQK
eukprot:g10669.t1